MSTTCSSQLNCDLNTWLREAYPFDAFPPYARGLLRAMSLDVVHSLARLAPKVPVIRGDDPSFGVHLRFLRHDDGFGVPLTLDDRESYRVFAMEPSCDLSAKAEWLKTWRR